MPNKPRRTRAELKQMMLDAGGEVLVDLIPDIGFERLTYNAVFDHLQESRGEKVTIGSVHERIWASQRDFQLDVLRSIVENVPEEQFAGAIVNVEGLANDIDLSTLAGRRYALQNVIRIGQNTAWLRATNMEVVEQIAVSLRLRLWPLGEDHVEAEGFRDVLRRNRRANAALWYELAKAWIDAVGVRPRGDAGTPDETLNAMISAISALSAGYISDVLEESRQVRQRPTGPNGELEDWYPHAWSTWTMMRGTYEFADEGLSPAERLL